MNILTFDIEEWFHLLDNDSTRSEEQWKRFEVRIYENMERIFRILEETDTKASRSVRARGGLSRYCMNWEFVWIARFFLRIMRMEECHHMFLRCLAGWNITE